MINQSNSITLNYQLMEEQLFKAAQDNDINRIKSLVADGANIQTIGKEILCNAIHNNDVEIVEYLIEQGVEAPEWEE